MKKDRNPSSPDGAGVVVFVVVELETAVQLKFVGTFGLPPEPDPASEEPTSAEVKSATGNFIVDE